MVKVTRASSLKYTNNIYNSTANKQTTPWKNGQKPCIDFLARKICRWPTSTLKKCSTSLINREMQIQTPARYHHTPIGMAITDTSTSNKRWWGVEKWEPSCTVGGNGSWYNRCGEQCGGTFEIYTENCHMIRQSNSCGYIQTKFP